MWPYHCFYRFNINYLLQTLTNANLDHAKIVDDALISLMTSSAFVEKDIPENDVKNVS